MVTFAWEHLSDFQRLLLIHILKPQSLTSSTRQFVEVQMGARFVSFGAADLSTCDRDMHELTGIRYAGVNP